MRALLLGTIFGSFVALSPAQITIEVPPLPGAGQIAFDAARGVTVMIGAKTWEWDGTNLALRAQSSPNGVPVYHAALARVAMVGPNGPGGVFVVRLWDGSSWNLQNPGPADPAMAPPDTYDAAYDVGRDRIVLFIGDSRRETWEWSSSGGWSQAVPATNPDKDMSFTMAHDAARGRTVLFSGVSRAPSFGWGTWEWDGTNWTYINDGPYALDTDSTFDARLNRVVIYGGQDTIEVTNYIYSWDGARWRPAGSGGNRPGDRYKHSIAYDSARGALLVHGGITLYPNQSAGYTGVAMSDLWSLGSTGAGCEFSSDPIRTRTGARIAAAPWRGEIMQFGGLLPQNAAMNDTWVWNGKVWRELLTQTAPGPRYAHVLATEVARGVVLMFGGRAPVGGLPGQEVEFGDTWAWDGGSWARVATTGPMPRSDAAMAHHGGTGLTILFGGRNQSVPLGDTWAWNGTAWTQLFPPASPPAMAQHEMAYDRARDVIVLFGASGTWEWNGVTWTQRQPASSPPAVSSMTYDDYRERIVARSGNQTWEWDHDDWIRRVPTGAQPAGGEIAFDAVRRRVVEVGTEGSGRTTEYFTEAPAAVASFGVSCTGGIVTPLHAAPDLPWIDATYHLLLTGLPSANPVALLFGISNTGGPGFSLPLALSGIGATGCSLYTSSEFALSLLPSSGVASLALPIPNDATLIGGTFYSQGIVLVPGANPAGVLLSNGLGSTVGAK